MPAQILKSTKAYYQQAEALYEGMGLGLSTTIWMFPFKSAHINGLPFQLQVLD
jgi:antitoxin component of RelBE/YafQ-DinJ toxin-antitoxin module